MKENRHLRSGRKKRKMFPLAIFIITFIVFATLTTIQMKIIGRYIDSANLPMSYHITIFLFWLIGAAIFTLFTRYQIKTHYEKPIEVFVEAAQKVASGDFSVYVPPRHTADKMDELDEIFFCFNKMVEELGSIETLKTDFFSNVSHEIKTPIAVIQNYAELLSKGNLSDEQMKEYTVSMMQATRRLSNLITNMLKLNKLEKQAIKPMAESYDLCEQLCECALQFEEIWESKEIEFVAEMEDRAMITADKGLLELVWTNLLSNAIKFTPKGGTVSLLQTAEKGALAITVQDTGCGMDEQIVGHIFDKFYQGDTSHSTEGNGLGLALVQRILELSEGTIIVSSHPDKGTSFTVKLPVPVTREEIKL